MTRTVPEAHPELFHYTSAAGLLGILDSQSLRATHSAFLNDSAEIALFLERRLPQLLESAILSELAADPKLQVLPQFARTPEEAHATVVRYAHDMAESIRITTMRFNQPYFVCFSTPATARIRAEGLLSQWRSYGRDGGYAIVFDSGALETLLRTEGTTFWYQHAQWGDVYYHQDGDDLVNAEPEIHEAEDALRNSIRGYIRDPSARQLEATFEPVASLSCLYKHWGFHEEREVRIVAIPPNEELTREGRASGETRVVRQPKIFLRGGTPVPYLDLFSREEQGTRLPIVRIIVGPHPQSHLRRQSVEQLLRTKGIVAEVQVSQIPYVGSEHW